MSWIEGVQAYVVGGAVRDRLLGLEVRDRDWVVVGATPEQMRRCGFRQVGADFPVFLHPHSHEEYALARTERKTAPGYRGFVFHAAPDVTLEADGETERCTITLGKPNPAVRQGGVVAMGPEDRASTCTLMTLGETYSDGSLAALEREGESKELHLTVSEGGKVIGKGSFKPDFTPDACGQREPEQIVAIRR